jgi:hypothetical protein
MTEPLQGELPLGAEPRSPRLLGFRSHLRVESVTGDATYLISDRGVTALQGSGVEALAPLLDGTRDLSQILRGTEPVLPLEQAGRLIGRLAREGLVGYRSGDAPSAAEAYWDLSGLNGAEALARLAESRAVLRTVGGASSDEVGKTLRLSNVAVAQGTDDASAQLTVVLCDDYLNPELLEVDAQERAAGRPWLLARLAGATVWIGPVFQPDAWRTASGATARGRRRCSGRSVFGARCRAPPPTSGPAVPRPHSSWPWRPSNGWPGTGIRASPRSWHWTR